MSEDQKVEDMRQELGRDAKLKGEPLHEGASEEFRRGYLEGRGPGSNVMPKNFGRTGELPSDWTCVCGHVNKGNVRRRVPGIGIVCWMCGLDMESALLAKGDD